MSQTRSIACSVVRLSLLRSVLVMKRPDVSLFAVSVLEAWPCQPGVSAALAAWLIRARAVPATALIAPPGGSAVANGDNCARWDQVNSRFVIVAAVAANVCAGAARASLRRSFVL